MTNSTDLKARLNALSERSTKGHAKTSTEFDWEFDGEEFNEILVEIGDAQAAGSFGTRSDAELFCLLVNSYRSGDLVTREELEAAVKAEREACAEVAAKFVNDRLYKADMPACSYHSRDIQAAIRARGEDQ